MSHFFSPFKIYKNVYFKVVLYDRYTRKFLFGVLREMPDFKAGTIQLIRPRGVKSHHLLALTMFSDGVVDQKIWEQKLLLLFVLSLKTAKSN